MAYAKIFPQLMDSTLWEESPETFKIFLTLILMADKKGFIPAKLPGITRRSLLPVEICEKALKVLSTPDTYSKTKDEDGKRIIEVEGGWQIVNYEKYQKMGNEEESQPTKSYIDNVHKYNTEHSPSKNTDINVIYPEFDKNSWMFALDIWKNAGPWISIKGEHENFYPAKKEFSKKITSLNWKEFIQKLDWAVTNSKRTGDRKYLGLFYTFLKDEKWKDVDPPNELIIQEPVKQVVKWDQEFIPDAEI